MLRLRHGAIRRVQDRPWLRLRRRIILFSPFVTVLESHLTWPDGVMMKPAAPTNAVDVQAPSKCLVLFVPTLGKTEIGMSYNATGGNDAPLPSPPHHRSRPKVTGSHRAGKAAVQRTPATSLRR